MTDLLTIIIIALLGMSLLLTVVWRILRRNPKQEQEPAESMLRSEFSRAQRAGKEVAVIDVKLAPGMKADLLSILGQKKTGHSRLRPGHPSFRRSVYRALARRGRKRTVRKCRRDGATTVSRYPRGVESKRHDLSPRQGKEIEELIALRRSELTSRPERNNRGCYDCVDCRIQLVVSTLDFPLSLAR